MQKFTVIVAAATVAVLAGCGGKAPDAAKGATAPVLESHATTRQVMLGITIPASDYLFKLEDHKPAGDKDWEVVVANAMAVAESANLLLSGARDLKQPEWTAFATAMIGAAKKTAAAAQEKDVEKVLDAGNELYETCDTCHAKYMPARAGEQAAPK